MTHSRILKLVAIPAIAMAVGLCAFGATQAPAGFASGALQGYSKPSDWADLKFTHPGLVADIAVKEGDQVHAGQLVARLNDEVEQASLKVDKDKADDTTSIQAETAVRDDKQVQYQRMLAKGAAMAQTELDAARMDVVVADARIKLAEHNHTQDILTYEKNKIAIEQLKVTSPIDGVVSETFLHVGEVAEGNDAKVMRVIVKDPMWVEVPVPVAVADRLKVGATASVSFPDKVRTGKVIHLADETDAGSQRRVIRLEVPNPEKRAPGDIVTVDFGAANLAKN